MLFVDAARRLYALREQTCSADKMIEALLTGLKVGKKIKQINKKDLEVDNRIRAVTTLNQLVYNDRKKSFGRS